MEGIPRSSLPIWFGSSAERSCSFTMEEAETGSDEEIALRGIEAMEDFYRQIHMPTNLHELGVEPTEEQMADMAHKCAVGAGGSIGSARKLSEKDMLAIYQASR